MPIPRHRLLVVLLLTTTLCLNLVFSQELRPFESETSSPRHQSRSASGNNENNPEDFDNLIVSNQSEARNGDGEESSDDGEDGGDGEEYSGDEGGHDGEEGSEDGEEEDEEAQGSVASLQYALPPSSFANFSELSYPDTNVSASSIIYRTADLETAATGWVFFCDNISNYQQNLRQNSKILELKFYTVMAVAVMDIVRVENIKVDTMDHKGIKRRRDTTALKGTRREIRATRIKISIKGTTDLMRGNQRGPRYGNYYISKKCDINYFASF